MPEIRVDIDYLSMLEKQLRNMSNDLRVIENGIYQAANNLDWDVPQKYRINDQLNNLRRKSISVIERTRQMELFVNKVIREFLAVDKGRSLELSGISRSFENLRNAIANAISRIYSGISTIGRRFIDGIQNIAGIIGSSARINNIFGLPSILKAIGNPSISVAPLLPLAIPSVIQQIISNAPSTGAAVGAGIAGAGIGGAAGAAGSAAGAVAGIGAGGADATGYENDEATSDTTVKQNESGTTYNYSETFTYKDKDGNSASLEWTISNEEFLDSNALTLEQITAIMNSKNPGLVERGFDKAVYEFAQNKGINPKVILATLAQEQTWCKNGNYDKAFGVGPGGNPISYTEQDKGGLAKSVNTYLKWFNVGKELEAKGELGPMKINCDEGPNYPETTAVFKGDTAKWQAANPDYVKYMEQGQNVTPVNAVNYAKLKYTPWVDFPPQKSHPLDDWHRIFRSF